MEKNPQEQLFVKNHKVYAAHYYDKESIKYRENFVYKYMFDKEDLNNKHIAELACGSW